MKKVKVFFVAAALVLVTAGVFAGKSRFTNVAANLYYEVSATDYVLLSSTIGGTNNFQYGTGGTQMKIEPAGTTDYLLFTYISGTGYEPVYY